MSLFDRFKDALKGEKDPTVERIGAYRRLGEQVYQVEVELAETSNKRALAILQAAKCLQLMADALFGDVSEPEMREVPSMTVKRVENWYSRIPDLLIASRQEANFPNSSQIALPVRLKDESYQPLDTWSTAHLVGLRRAVDAVATSLKRRMEHPQFQSETYKNVILAFQEARTRQDAGDAIVGLLIQGQSVSDPSRKEAEQQYMSTLGHYLLIAQGLEEPDVLGYEQIAVDFGETGHGTSDATHSAVGGDHPMNFEQMQQQSNNIQQHNQTIVNQLQQVVAKLQQVESNDPAKQDISYSLREVALSVRGLNQETMGLLQNMALYIQHLEDSHQQRDHYQQQYPPQYQQVPPQYQQQPVQMGGGIFGRSGGGFWDTLIKSAEIGAGFEIGADIVNDIFDGF